MRACKGRPKVKANKCEMERCAESFDSFQGLQVHKARSHRKEYNETLPEKGVFKWGEVELKDLARAEVELNEEGVTVTVSKGNFPIER